MKCKTYSESPILPFPFLTVKQIGYQDTVDFNTAWNASCLFITSEQRQFRAFRSMLSSFFKKCCDSQWCVLTSYNINFNKWLMTCIYAGVRVILFFFPEVQDNKCSEYTCTCSSMFVDDLKYRLQDFGPNEHLSFPKVGKFEMPYL